MSQLASSLLQVITHSKQRESKPGKIPLYMEFPVNPDLSPFLVSRTSSNEMSLWVSRSRNGVIRAGLRHVSCLEDYYVEVVRKVIAKGRAEKWGNIHPLTRDGIKAAIAHLKDYDFQEMEILAHPQISWGDIEAEWDNSGKGMVLTLLGQPVQPAPWLPMDTVVVVPRDREMVGFAFLTQERLASVVHNAARGIGIATANNPEPPEAAP